MKIIKSQDNTIYELVNEEFDEDYIEVDLTLMEKQWVYKAMTEYCQVQKFLKERYEVE